MERVKILESNTEESIGIREAVCMKSVVRNWRDPTHHRKVKRKRISYQYPSRKAMKKMKAEIKRNVNNRSLLVAKEEDLIKNLNPKITGWKNYYSTKTNEKWMQALVHRIISNWLLDLSDFSSAALSSIDVATATPHSSALHMKQSSCVNVSETYFSVS